MWDVAVKSKQDNPAASVARAPTTEDLDPESRQMRAQLNELEDQRRVLDARLRARWGTQPTTSAGLASGPGGYEPSFVNGIFVGERSDSSELQLYILRCFAAMRTRRMPLRGVEQRGEGLGIDRLYVPLLTDLRMAPEQAERALAAAREGGDPPFPQPDANAERVPDAARARYLSACEASILRRSLVILGDPGAGKTTLLAFLAHSLATGDRAALPAWPKTEWTSLPLLMRLRDFAVWLTDQGAAAPADDALVWGYLRHELAERNLSFCLGALEAAVWEGTVVLLWDGLDEVPPGVLSRVRAGLLAFRDQARGCRYILTSRVLSYHQLEWRLPEADFPIASLLPFDAGQSDLFVRDWFQEQGSSGELLFADAEHLYEDFREGLKRGHLGRLVANPLLLNLLLLVFAHRRDLPEVRAKVFEAAIEVLISRMDADIDAAAMRISDLLREARRDRCDLIRLFERLAMRLQTNGDGGTSATNPGALGGSLGEAELLEALQALHHGRDLEWAQVVLDLIKQGAGLLREESPGRFDFPHRALREYLVGCHLAHTPDFAAQVIGLAHDRPYWHEPILHGVAFLVHNQRECYRPLELIERLCPPDALDDDVAWRRVWLAGEVAVEVGTSRADEVASGAHAMERVRHRLAVLLEGGWLQLGERVAAAAVLARLGDPRFQPRGLHLPARYRGEREKALGMVRVRHGRFGMGSAADTAGALAHEVGDLTLELDYSFWIGRYPVTVAQFRVFIGAGGYTRRDWWTARGWEWCQGQSRREPEGWSHQRSEINRPVVGINWFEAVAYGAWLNAQWRKRNSQIPEGYGLRLPTEAEWELAAHGSRGRVYPWGASYAAGHANCMGTLGAPSVVGLFPQGATPDGVMDLAGNVWEWTLSRDRPYPYDPADGRNDPDLDGVRILRGGSYDAGPLRARTAARARAPMREVARDIGCRLVLSLLDSAV